MKFIKNSTLLILLTIFFTLSTQAQKNKALVDKILAIVGGEIILLSDVELQYQQLKIENENITEDKKCNLL